MSGFEYPKDYYDPEPYPEKEEQTPTPTSYLVRDIAAYVQHMNILNRGVMPGEPDPVLGLHWMTNTSDNSLGASRLILQAMRREGYKIYEYAIARNVYDEVSPDSIAHYVNPDDTQAVRSIMYLLHLGPHLHPQTFSPLLFRVTDGVIVSQELLNPQRAEETRQRLIPPDHEAEAKSLMERAFLTARVFFNIRRMHDSAELGSPMFVNDEQTLATYEALRERGVQPFGVEELIGMASSSVNHILRHHDIPAPADQDEY